MNGQESNFFCLHLLNYSAFDFSCLAAKGCAVQAPVLLRPVWKLTFGGNSVSQEKQFNEKINNPTSSLVVIVVNFKGSIKKML